MHNLKTPSFSHPEKVCLRVAFLLPNTNPFYICSRAVVWIQQRWQGLTQQDTGTEQGSHPLPGHGSIHLTPGTARSPDWGLSWDTAQALLGSAGKAQHGLCKSRWKLFCWLPRRPWFSSPRPPWQPAGVHRRAWRGEKNLLEEVWNISAGEWQVTPCTWMELNPEQWEVLQIFRHHRLGFTEITVLSWKPGNSLRRRCGLGQCMWAKNFPSASAAFKIWVEY